MNRQRLTAFLLLTLLFVCVSAIYFRGVWNDSTTRFRTGLPVPRTILPPELLKPEELIPSGPPKAPAIRSFDPLLYGNASSAVTIIEYGDFQCEYCREQAQALEQALQITNPGPRLRVVWRNLPLVTEHPRALAAANVAQCAAQQGKFKQMYDALFFRATNFSDTEFLAFARDIGLNQDAFLVCLRDPAIPFRLQRDIEEARTLGITSVPLTFVNGEPLEGFTDAETLSAVIEKALETTRSP